MQHQRIRWLNNWAEHDHRRIKRRIPPILDAKRFVTARRTLAGIEAMAMLSKEQVHAVPTGNITVQQAFIHQIFGRAG